MEIEANEREAMQRVRVVSDGTAEGTKVTGADGREITGWSRIGMSAKANRPVKIFLEFETTHVDILGDIAVPNSGARK
jgi:hypothetical protein